ncbi:MAG: hypothetical protein GY842_13090 [bacterium]|nr:hypothetical protein [bacterium]
MAKRGRLALVIAELLLLAAAKRCLDDLHDGQKRVVWARDEIAAPVAGQLPLADRVALLSGRRFGKTEGLIRYACALCMSPHWHGKPGAVIYVTLSKDSAEEIVWPIIKNLKRIYGWDCKLDKRKLRVTWPNGGYLRLVGADHQRFAKLIRGQEYDAAIIDEAQDFTYINLKHLCDRILSKTLTDRCGRMFMAGTPGEQEGGYFWEVVWKGLEELDRGVAISKTHPIWTVVHGGPFENPYNAAQDRRQLAREKLANPRIEEEPWVQREYFGKWVADNRLLMVTLRPHLNYLYEWEPADDERFILSIDWGWTPAAYSLSAWNPRRHNNLVYLEAWEREEMMLADHLAAIREYIDHKVWGRDLTIIADPGGSSKTILEEIRRTYNIPLQNADKDGKDLTVQQINKEASTGNILVYNIHDPEHPEDNGVAKQWRSLTWKVDPVTKAREEGKPRHIHDTALYARKRARIHLFTPAEVIEIDPNDELRQRKNRIAMRRRRRHR